MAQDSRGALGGESQGSVTGTQCSIPGKGSLWAGHSVKCSVHG